MPLQNANADTALRRALQNALPTCVPAFAFSAALAAMAAFAPTTAAAHPHTPSSDAVNTQFVTAKSAQEIGRLEIRNTSIRPRTVYARFAMPDDPGNRNYGFVQTIPPLSKIAYDLPLGVRVFACDGKYWDDYRPDEAFAVTIERAKTYSFAHSQFKPAALRRAR